MIRTTISILATMLLALGCGGPSTSGPSTDNGSAPECAEDGWPQPTGEMAEGCEAVHGGCCYPTAAAACTAAGCEPDACMVLESYPAQVKCGTAGPGAEPAEPAERPSMTAEECEAAPGTVVGDIGDGAVHRPDYTCPNGEKPIGTVPSGIEGAVCCPASGGR